MTVIQRFRIFHLAILRDHLGNVTKPLPLFEKAFRKHKRPVAKN
jgi:hypothetical protein